AAGELVADVVHRHWTRSACFHRYVSFGKGGVSSRPLQVQGCAGKSGSHDLRRFLRVHRRRLLRRIHVSRLSYAGLGHALPRASLGVDWCLYSAGSAVRSSARLPESAGHRRHGHTRHFDGTAGAGVEAHSLVRDHRTWSFRREPFRLVLFSRAADWLISLIGGCVSESSAIQQARIEPVFDWLADLDFFEIAMLGI